MRSFEGKIAIITGAGTGIGRALTRVLVAQGCHVASCDIIESNLEETLAQCRDDNPGGVTISGHLCDVADEEQVLRFSREVKARHATSHINLLINNAGINGGGSFINSTREEWERTFNICWTGVYLVTRTFMPMLLASSEGHLVNMSSANALRAVLGGHVPHTAYSSAKFAVRGFSEALIHDFRFNAPHLGVSVVMPGAVGTELLTNSAYILGQSPPENWTHADIEKVRRRWTISGRSDVADMADEEVRVAGKKEIEDLRQLGLTPTAAANIILDGVKQKTWRILIGTDTQSLDTLVRESPDTAYEPDFVERWRAANNQLSNPD